MIARRLAALTALVSPLLLAGCYADDIADMTTTSTSAGGSGGGASSSSSSGGGTGGTGGTGGGAFMTAAHPDPPQVVTFGGKVLATPKVQIISWTSDPFMADVDAFVTELGKTSTWAEQTAEYGVGALTVLPPIHLTDAPPASFDDETGDPTPFEQYLAAQLSGDTPAWGAADPSTMYLFVFPEETDIQSFGHCCSDFLGYHYEAPVGAGSVAYGIACHCPAAMGDTLTPLQYVTTTIIHEMVEMATDPFFVSDPAWAQSDDANIGWTVLTGGEVSDMCEYNADSNYTPPGATYMVQRSWSNAAAKAGKNPCVPVPPGEPYFNAAPVLPDMVKLDLYGSPVTTGGVVIPVGKARTIDVQLWSEAPTSVPWTVTAWDLDDFLGFGSPRLDFAFDHATGTNGDVLKLTITVKSKDPDLGGEAFVLVSNIGGQENMAMGVVGN